MRIRVLASAALATTVAVGLLAPSAAVAATGPHTVDVVGTYTRVVIDGASGGGTVTQPIVTIADTTLPLPAAAAVGLRPDTEVTVSVSAPVGADTPAEVAEAVSDGAARILDADPAPVAAAVSAGNAGAHTLIVLPVYWTAPDAQTTTTLRTTAGQLASYWNTETAGAITVPTVDVRDWAPIANPGSCNYGAIATAARAAHGVAAPTGRTHVLVYFPNYSSCGWAGLASMPGRDIWINGYSYADAWEHEFGHNLGLGHANAATCTQSGVTVPLSSTCTTASYDDLDVMGYARYGDGYHLNTALADVLGTLSNPVVAATGVAVTLPAVTSINAARAVKVPLTGSTLYLEYRPRAGRDANLPAGWAGLQVHQLMTGANESRMLNMTPATANTRALQVGASWTVSGTTMTIKVEQIDASGLRVKVGNTFGDVTPPPAPAAAKVTATGVSGEYVAGPVKLTWPAVIDP